MLEEEHAPTSSRMEHHVYFWLGADHQDESSRAVFESGLDTLCTSPFIAEHHWGKPAATAERPVTDHSWDYAVSLKFSSMGDHDSYQEGDPIHDAFIAKFKEWWAKVLVMDLA
ncbi:Dabb family protein [bacterium]|nr:Dabb family protein [Akkermansiaceae bacterium]MDB4310990.1 Dabb family protein [bacterium]MDB4322585.1 Dabb family protein [Akkermansiaceae bacterium]MDB4692815.1 Dabb family protein [Akkermansiaceae bacterium]MDC1404215.1 Dabb family protein [Akkermansiaceae bacterium]